jgi:hypothetical protein
MNLLAHWRGRDDLPRSALKTLTLDFAADGILWQPEFAQACAMVNGTPAAKRTIHLLKHRTYYVLSIVANPAVTFRLTNTVCLDCIGHE